MATQGRYYRVYAHESKNGSMRNWDKMQPGKFGLHEASERVKELNARAAPGKTYYSRLDRSLLYGRP